MNINEKAVLDLIKADPYISQKDIGSELKLTRSTVASIISNLTRKKIIKGRGYILNEIDSGVFCIGGMNVDRKFYLMEDLILKTSNPARSETFVGGVGRNVCENLGRLGFVPSLISVAGTDSDFEFIKKESGSFVNFDSVKTFEDASTGSYSALLDPKGDMVLAIADMNVYEKMDLDWIRSYIEVLKNARLIILDLNTPKDVVQWTIDFAKTNEIDLVVITVSSPKMKRLTKDLDGVKWLVTNQDESEAFFQRKVSREEDFLALADAWLETGLENIIITRGTKSCLYKNKFGQEMLFKTPLAQEVVDVTGAGDSFTAAIIYGLLMEYDKKMTVELALTNAYYTVQRKETVRKDLTNIKLEEERENLIKGGLL
ncbi:MAG: winged helix-turn-helix transcriptional regulator [Bacillota bacterium]|nr:winged helix-turn-helix transcriptional regulator [Bacillota bacterium]